MMNSIKRLGVGMLLTVALPVYASENLPNLSNSHFQQCLDKLKVSPAFKQISYATFEQYRPTKPDPSVIRLLNHQPEFKKDVWDYHASLVDSERVEDGIKAKVEQADVLRRIEARYGVKAEHVLGVWGVESNFGQTLGKKISLTAWRRCLALTVVSRIFAVSMPAP